jgi:hypothetical protein
MSGPETRAARRARERAERDQERRIRRMVIQTVATLAETDSTVSGATLISPNGTVEYIDAGLLRHGGRA